MRIFIAFIFFSGTLPARAQVHDESARAELIESGSGLLRREMSTEDFLNSARRMQEQRQLNQEEKTFLTDLSEKLPPAEAKQVCAGGSSGLCAENHQAPVANLPVAFDGENQLPSPDKSGWSKPMLWAAGIALVVLVGATAMRGKELVLHRP